MQPPPQTGPPGAGAPPRMGTTSTPYWRKRTPTPSAMAPPPVQPVTDPFAFGRMTPQNIPPAPNATILSTQSPSPSLYPQPVASFGDGAQVSISGSASHPIGAGPSYSNMSAPPVQGGHCASNMAALPAASSLQNMAGGLEKTPVLGRSHSEQGIDMEMNSSSGTLPLPHPYPPATSQQTTAPWSSSQAAPPTSAQHPVYTAPYYSPPYLEVSHLPPQTSDPSYFSAPQRTPPVPFPLGGGSGQIQQNMPTYSNIMPVDYPQNQNHEHWFNQPYPEPLKPAAMSNPMPENRPQSEPARPLGQATGDADSGTVSMFFKGDEAENVEIPSTDQQHMPRRQSVDTAYHQNQGRPGNVHLFTASPGAPPVVPPLPLHPSAPMTHPSAPLPQSASGFHDPYIPWKASNTENQPAEAKTGSELPYDNVENIEVLPTEPSKNSLFSAGVNPELFRYGPILGSALPKNPVGPSAVGPNLEAPDMFSPPVRSDSVSSSYSNLSHRSLPTAARPQELEGTFIQKEIGRPDNENSSNFFKQIDSSPLAGDIITHGMTPNAYHGNLSHPPTPSPPKPTGIFQASVNSSFEPVRSHAGVKAAESDPSKVASDVRENHKLQPTSSHNAGLAASPGNLEQPPDNLETIFLGKSNAEICAVTSGHHFPGGSALDNVSLLLEKRPSSRAHGSNKKCESPATTLWAQGELPNFGGNVLLAPPAPALYVPPKPQTEVIQPPEDGSLEAQHGQMDQNQFSASPEEHISSENLENPPKMGDDEHTQSQASSGYASLLSSPPTETLQNQPVLITQPSKAYNLVQPVNFSLSLPNQIKNLNSAKDFSAADKPLPPGGFAADPSASAFLVQLGPHKPPSSSTLVNKSAAGGELFSESFSNHQNALLSSTNQIPLNLVAENQKMAKTESPANESISKPALPSSGANILMGNGAGMYIPLVSNGPTKPENAGALDFTVQRVPANQSANGRVPVQNRPLAGAPLYTTQVAAVPSFLPSPSNNREVFYQQVTKDAQSHPSVETSQPTPGVPHEYMTPASQPPAPSVQPMQGTNKPAAYPQQTEAPVPAAQNSASFPYGGATEPGAKYGQPEYPPYPSQHASTTSAPINPTHPTGYPDPSRPPASQTPQQADPYYYYRGYGAYPSAYQQPYPSVDPRAPHLYYQDSYGAYDPAYRQYSNPVNPGKYQEPERPSSRSSHCSDRPSSRQGYAAPGSYYDYYQSQYEYGDPTRWDRYPGAYDPGYRDPRSTYWNYMYGSREDAYSRKVPYAYTSRYDVYEDRWQYDPRYVGGFDDEPDARRDLTKDDFDRRSVHSEHSARSVHSERSTHSRRSSFSSRSQQSQVYKSEQDLTANAYGGQVPNPPLEDYSYGLYPNDYSAQQSLDSYQYGYPGGSEWQPVEQVPSRSLTPEKFGSPHVCARFGPGGHLIKVLPNLPSDGQPTLVEIHNMEVILQNSPEQERMRTFPGPLIKDETHKVDVINFAQNKAKECSQNGNLLDQESARLLWDFIVLMCRQNGTVVGTDIAELLLQDHKTVWLPGKSPNEANLIDFTNEPLEQHEEESGASQLSFLTDTLSSSGAVLEKETERFRELLLFGRKKDALESAMKHGLWGHALLLASKMDSRTHARVMTRFANSLPINDPLQTVYQLLSGRMPAAATCCGDEKWGDWRPHLAMVLSNLTNNVDVPTRTIMTMGDTLASRGLLEAAHFCYLMAQVGFGVFTKKTTKLVLIGSNHSLPFAKFATNEAIQRTEAYEYAQSLGAQTIFLPNIQVFKFIYACRLAEYGLSGQAFHYCEVISKTIIKHPSYYSPVLVGQLLEVSSHLRFFDPQLKEKPEQELFVEPPWLLHLRHLDMQMKQGIVVYNTGRTTPQQYTCSTPSSEPDHVSQSDGMAAAHDVPAVTENPLLTNFLPSMASAPGLQLALPGPDNSAALYHPPPDSEPSLGPPQTYIPSAMLAPPLPGPGFVPVTSDQVLTYTPAPMESAPSPPQPAEHWSQDPALQRPPTSSPSKTTFHDTGFDFYGEMAKMVPGQRSRTVSQSSSHMRRTRTTSESSAHSIGSTRRRSSLGLQPSPPPIPEVKKPEPKKEPKSKAAQGSGRSWFGWLMRKGKNEAHLPDDRNKSIVWDETRQRWINTDEPEGEDIKPLPPPPSGMPRRPAPPGPGALSAPPNPSVNVFSIKAGGARARYVDVLNPGGNKPTSSVPPPADLFAPLAPMPIPTSLFVPTAVPEETQSPVGSEAEVAPPSDQPGMDSIAQTQVLSTVPGLDLPAINPEDDVPSGEASANMAAAAGPPPPTAAVPFYNPASFAQPPASSGAARPGRLGQRKYPSLK